MSVLLHHQTKTNNIMEILTLIKPANHYYSNGRMHYEKSETWYETKEYITKINGVNVIAKKIGSTKESMTEFYYKVGGNNRYKIGITKDEVMVKISEIELRIAFSLNDNQKPSKENIQVGRKIWEREIKNSLEEALLTLMTCGRYCALERRYFAKKLIDKNIITIKMLVNYTDSLMI